MGAGEGLGGWGDGEGGEGVGGCAGVRRGAGWVEGEECLQDSC